VVGLGLSLKKIRNVSGSQNMTVRSSLVCGDDHKPLFRQTCETNSETRLSLKSVKVGDEPNLLKLVFASFS